MMRVLNMKRYLPIFLMIVFAGCQTAPITPDRPQQTISPCAERLHEIAGALLLHYAANGALPQSLEELNAPPAVCPISQKPYYYKPAAAIAGQGRRLIVHDASAAHSGGYWGIAIGSSSPGSPVTADVIWFSSDAIHALD